RTVPAMPAAPASASRPSSAARPGWAPPAEACGPTVLPDISDVRLSGGSQMTGSKRGALLLAALLAFGSAQAATVSAWVEMTGDAQSLRAIATEACPAAAADGKPSALSQRSA